MPSTVLLIRHPESAWNRKGVYQGQRDIPLSPLGEAQAKLVATRLARENVCGVICSPLQRAHVLARAIGEKHGLTPQTDERLTEIGHGVWEGLSRPEVADRYPEMYQTWTECPHEVTFPGADGESLSQVHERSIPPVEELLRLPGNDTWVVVTHDTVCRLVVAAAEQQPVTGFTAVGLENAGITTLVGPDLVGSVRCVNAVDHLGEHRVDLAAQAL